MWLAFGIGAFLGALVGFLAAVLSAASAIADTRARNALLQLTVARLREERDLLLGTKNERN